MPAKKNAVTTPLHLLQQLSKSLVVHLEQACADAQKDAETLLAQLEKQRGKTQEKLIKARAKLDDAGSAGKSKAQSKARARLAELDDMLALLQSRQNETLNYLSELKRDAAQSLSLAQGVSQVEKDAAQALASRGKPASSAKTRAASEKPSTPRARPAASAKASTVKSSQASATPGVDKTAVPATRSANSRAKSSAAGASSTAKPAAVRKPAAARKPTAPKRERADQAPPFASS